MTCAVFCGPTIPAAEVGRLLPAAVLLPPVAQGDVLRVTERLRPRLLAVVDGYFHLVPSVWHKEILWGLSQGIRVFGSSSMGALRAAELADFGMVGIGEIFARYRSGQYEDDDDVAVLHAPASEGYRVLSEAMVNVRATLEAATGEGAVPADLAAQIAALAKGLHYSERTYPRLLGLAAESGLAGPDLERFAAWLPAGKRDQKLLDARALLRRLREESVAGPEGRASGPPGNHGAHPFQFAHTVAWNNTVRAADELLVQVDDGWLTVVDVFEELLVAPSDAGAPLLREPAFARLAAARNRVRGHRPAAPARTDPGMLAAVAGCAGGSVLRRALDKWRVLALRGLSEPEPADAGLPVEELVDWFLGCLPRTEEVQRTVLRYAESAPGRFLRAAARERLYRSATGSAAPGAIPGVPP